MTQKWELDISVRLSSRLKLSPAKQRTTRQLGCWIVQHRNEQENTRVEQLAYWHTRHTPKLSVPVQLHRCTVLTADSAGIAKCSGHFTRIVEIQVAGRQDIRACRSCQSLSCQEST